jgi:hypothetical protein
MSDLVKTFRDRHEANVKNFDIPEKLVDGGPIWRFSAVVIDTVGTEERFGWPDLVPVYSGTKLIGSARLFPKGVHIVGEFSVLHDIPERLDHENGLDLFCDIRDYAEIEGGGFNIVSLELTYSGHGVFAISTLEEL